MATLRDIRASEGSTITERHMVVAMRSLTNRVFSILHDSEWVEEVQEAYELPLVPNERCGTWYVPPEKREDSAYFKSTDGHTNEWTFSTRRLNFHLLDLMVENNGIIIVDSTRKGKSMPDSLSKTIPIWCAVLNYIMFGEHETNWCFVPPQIISKNEHKSIIKLIPGFAKEVEELGLITKEQLMTKFKGKYIRPLWVHPGFVLPFEAPEFEDFVPIVNCVASFQTGDQGVTLRKSLDDGSGHRIAEYRYIQGAADDHELWAFNLTADLLWQERETIEANIHFSNANDSHKYIQGLKLTNNSKSSVEDVVKLTDDLSIGKVVDDIDPETLTEFDTIILLSKQFEFENDEETKKSIHRYQLSPDKRGSNDLRKYAQEISSSFNGNTLIVCENGTDLSPGVALLYLATEYDTTWEPVEEDPIVTKNTIKKHLAKILEKKRVNPSRATLQSINAFLM